MTAATLVLDRFDAPLIATTFGDRTRLRKVLALSLVAVLATVLVGCFQVLAIVGLVINVLNRVGVFGDGAFSKFMGIVGMACSVVGMVGGFLASGVQAPAMVADANGAIIAEQGAALGSGVEVFPVANPYDSIQMVDLAEAGSGVEVFPVANPYDSIQAVDLAETANGACTYDFNTGTFGSTGPCVPADGAGYPQCTDADPFPLTGGQSGFESASNGSLTETNWAGTPNPNITDADRTTGVLWSEGQQLEAAAAAAEEQRVLNILNDVRPPEATPIDLTFDSQG